MCCVPQVNRLNAEVEEERSARRLLAFASFNKRGHENTYQQMSLRTVLEQQCRRSAPECQFLPLSSGKVTMYSLFGERRHPVLKELLHSMHGAVFSLQPAGDDPSRKGIIDSLTVGCIPVIFHKEQQELWPLHWGPWVNDSHVFIPADDLLSGRVDVIQVLRAVPQSRIFNMHGRTLRAVLNRWSIRTSHFRTTLLKPCLTESSTQQQATLTDNER